MTRHFDHVIDVNVVLSVDKLRQKVEANVHVRGKEIHAESIEPDMYAAIDCLADKLDRQVAEIQGKAVRAPHRSRDDRTLAAGVERPARGRLTAYNFRSPCRRASGH